jgi:dTDP-L-rhamnose 4-epimerase
MRNVLITGGAGFIGSNLALALIQKGYNVTILDNLSPQIHGDDALSKSSLYLSIKEKVKFIHGCVTSLEDWRTAILGQDIIVHLAAETGTGQSMYEIDKYVEVNIGGTSKLLNYLANNHHSVKKIIIASSRSIYGEGKYWSEEYKTSVYPNQRTEEFMMKGDFEVKIKGLNSPLALVATDEDSKIHPSSVYGITKQNQEQMIMTVCPTIGIVPVAFRYQNVYGPGQSLSNPYTGILSIFSSLILNRKVINIFEDGKESRDFVFIDDVVDATILGIEKEEANGEVFTGQPIEVLTVAKKLIENFNYKTNLIISGNYRIGDIRHNFADLTKIKSLLGFTPKYSFEEGIKIFVNWVKTQKIKESKYDESIAVMREKGLYK